MNALLREFDLRHITVQDPYEVNAYEKEAAYLLALDTQRLLKGFYENAGIKTHFIRYNGWENSLIAGHSLGHYLTAISQCYANPLTKEDRKQQIAKKLSHLIDELLECQKRSKGKKGFLWGANVIDDDNVEKQFDNVEENKTNIMTQAWVPWYTMHKIIAGLVSVYRFTQNEKAKEILSDLCDWVYNRVKTWDEEKIRTVLSIEYGGMNDCLYNAYQITKKEEHLYAAHIFDEEELFDKVLSQKENVLNDLHANTTIPKFLGALNRYLVTGEKRYLSIAVSFFDLVTQKHAYITGDVSEWEHFGKDNVLDSERTQYNCETCAAYNLLMMARTLFIITKQKKYADYYERAYLNTILAAQNPQTGMATYFQPMASGFFKVYSTPFDSFWCCTGTGMEDFTKLGDSFYFTDGETLYINLFRSSSVWWEEKNLTVIQTSSVPESDTVRFRFDCEESTKITLKLRIPEWAKGECTVRIDGKDFPAEREDGYATVRTAVSRDTLVTYTIPLGITAESLPDQKDVHAFRYGPLVLSARLSQERMDIGFTGVEVNVPKRAILPSKTMYFTDVKKEDFFAAPEKYFCKENGLQFRLRGLDKAYTFIPYYGEYTHRYGIYWYFKEESERIDEEEGREILDTVQPGYGQYENDALHDMQEKNSVGCTSDGTTRYAKANGFFTYRMKIEEGRENYLVFSLSKEDFGKSLLIKIGEDTLYQTTLRYTGEKEYYEVKLEIPKTIVERHKKRINAIGEECTVLPVTFSSADERDSARVCEFIYIVH